MAQILISVKKIKFFSLHIMFEITHIYLFGVGDVRLTRKMDMQHETVLT